MGLLGSVRHAIAILGAVLATSLLLQGCSGGGGGPPSGNGPRPWAIDDTAFSGNGTDLLEGGDMFLGETDLAAAAALGDQIWATLVSATTWVGASSPNTYEFYVDSDPLTNWGRAYRYTGQSVIVGPVIGAPGFYGTGTYVGASGQPYDAVILRTWDNSYWELLAVQSPTSLVHAIQNINGLPIVTFYDAN